MLPVQTAQIEAEKRTTEFVVIRRRNTVANYAVYHTAFKIFSKFLGKNHPTKEPKSCAYSVPEDIRYFEFESIVFIFSGQTSSPKKLDFPATSESEHHLRGLDLNALSSNPI